MAVKKKPERKSHREEGGVDYSPITTALATQYARDTFDKYRKDTARRWRIFYTTALGISMAMNAYQLTRPQVIRYIPTNSNGQIMPLVALNTPNLSDEQVAIWVTKAITDTFSFNYVNYREVLGKAKGDYTPEAWERFEANVLPHLIETVRENQYILSAQPTQTPTKEATGLDNGVFSWRYKIPFHLTFHSGNDNSSRDAGNSSSHDVIIEVVVKRQAETLQQNGLGISQVIMTED